MTRPLDHPLDGERVVASWDGPGHPIMLAIYDHDDAVARVRLSPARALTLGKEVVERGVAAAKSNQERRLKAEQAGRVV